MPAVGECCCCSQRVTVLDVSILMLIQNLQSGLLGRGVGDLDADDPLRIGVLHFDIPIGSRDLLSDAFETGVERGFLRMCVVAADAIHRGDSDVIIDGDVQEVSALRVPVFHDIAV